MMPVTDLQDILKKQVVFAFFTAAIRLSSISSCLNNIWLTAKVLVLMSFAPARIYFL